MEPFLAEIRVTSSAIAPKGWTLCNGQLLPINQNQALFSLMGTTYNGDGVNTYALPDLRGRVPVHQGNNGQSNYIVGQQGGVETLTLTPGQMPVRTHAMRASTSPASAAHGPSEGLGSSTSTRFYGTGTPTMAMDPNALAQVGGGRPHDNLPPYLAVSFIIALQGIFPPRS